MGNSPPKRASAVRERERELERFCNPTGLYPSCPWDVRVVRRLILEKRLAPRYPGRDSCESCFTQECPICFMFYPGVLNLSTCCKKPICSECYLQLKPPQKTVSCPYCNRESFGVKYAAPAAVVSLSSVYSTHASPVPTPPPRAAPSTTTTTAAMHTTSSGGDSAAIDASQHFASVQDRDRIRDDLRSQLQLTDQPIVPPPPPPPPAHPPAAASSRPSLSQRSRLSSNGTSFIIRSAEDAAMLAEPRYIIASASDAARLEEMMVMEAIRRSMRDLMPKDEEEEEEEQGENDSEESDIEYEYSSSDEDTGGPSFSTDMAGDLEGRAGSDYEILRQFQSSPRPRLSSTPFEETDASNSQPRT